MISSGTHPSNDIAIIIIIAALPFLLAQGIWMFRDAQKRGIFPWLWGIWGLIYFPIPILIYYIFVIRKDKKRK